MAVEPKVLLLDEPLSALDLKLRQRMRTELREIQKRVNITFIYITHDQGEALTMSNRIAVFNDGYVQQLSSPAELYEKPQNSFVAKFIGENNTINGEVIEINNSECKVKIDTGETVIANPIAVKNVGDKTSMSLRAERIIINPHQDTVNKFEAKIEEIIYHGDHTRLRVNLINQDDFILKVPNSDSSSNLSINKTIQVGWKSEDCRALDLAS